MMEQEQHNNQVNFHIRDLAIIYIGYPVPE